MYKIDKDIPIPSGYIKFPFGEMEVGDSFFVPLGNREVSSIQASVMASAAGRFPERKFLTRSLKDEKGVRVWRIK